MNRTPWIVFVLLLLLQPVAAVAHDTRPLYVEINERDKNAFSVMWKVPITVAATNVPDIRLPDTCQAAGPATGSKTTREQTYRCDTDLSNESITIHYPRYNPSISSLFHFTRLSGEKYSVVLSPEKSVWQVPEKEHNESISIHYPRYNPSISSLFHFTRLSGEKYSVVLSPEKSVWQVPEKEQTWKVAKEYMALGIDHILKGYDHLLFVACLVLISGTLRRILITVTGFTIAHSITLGLAALGLVRVAVPPVEAAVALSIVFLAMELAREKRDTLTWRYPIAVSVSFGLLHGFGFASVLGEIGLPQTEIPAALLFFNIGVEIGQILFVLVLIALFRVVQGAVNLTAKPQLGMADTALLHRPAGYLVGTLAAFWMVDRIASFWV